VTGGVRTPSDALVGPFAVAALRTIHVDLVFMGVHGMDPHSGFTTPNLLEAETNQALVESGRRLVVVADHTKWGVIGISSIARLDQADVLISDVGLDADARLALGREVRELILADPSAGSASASGPAAVSGSGDTAHRPRDERTTRAGRGAAFDPAPERAASPLQPAHRRVALVSAGGPAGRGRPKGDPPAGGAGRTTNCYPCPGNVRASEHSLSYDSTFVFTNDFSALRPGRPQRIEVGLLRAEGEAGACHVLCFSPRHDLTLALMEVEAVRRVVDVWAAETVELGERFRWVQVFENRGQIMGASNPHPHGQVWAGSALPREATKEDGAQRRYHATRGSRLLLDYAARSSVVRRSSRPAGN
jgi:hypothetical protein